MDIVWSIDVNDDSYIIMKKCDSVSANLLKHIIMPHRYVLYYIFVLVTRF
jgi:hypothetical protein